MRSVESFQNERGEKMTDKVVSDQNKHKSKGERSDLDIYLASILFSVNFSLHVILKYTLFSECLYSVGFYAFRIMETQSKFMFILCEIFSEETERICLHLPFVC